MIQYIKNRLLHIFQEPNFVLSNQAAQVNEFFNKLPFLWLGLFGTWMSTPYSPHPLLAALGGTWKVAESGALCAAEPSCRGPFGSLAPLPDGKPPTQPLGK